MRGGGLDAPGGGLCPFNARVSAGTGLAQAKITHFALFLTPNPLTAGLWNDKICGIIEVAVPLLLMDANKLAANGH